MHKPLKLAALCVLGAIVLGPPAGAQSEVEDPMDVGLELVAEGLASPVYLAVPPDASGRLFVIDQTGLIRIVAQDGTLLDEPFLDLRGRIVPLNPGFDERGLLGLAFHPGYARNGRFFVYYSAPLRDGAPEGFDHTSHVSEFAVSGDPDRADPGSERIVLQVDQPQFNHNAGTVLFGPDGLLYVALGDGGGRDDDLAGHVEDWYDGNAGGNGQDVEENLLGSILRLDVDGGDPYAVPADNPFVGGPGLDEIWAYGFRNPYRCSFDMGGGALLCQDAGQELWEEVSLVTAGGNYGWNVKEGTHCFDAEAPTTIPESCPDVVGAGHPAEGDPLIDPVIELANTKNPFVEGLGLTVIGGHVYRGAAVPQLGGRYVFGTWSTSFAAPEGHVFASKPRAPGKGLWKVKELRFTGTPDGSLGHFVIGFGQDAAGEVYVLTTDSVGPTGETGKVYRIVQPGH